jgi:NADPH:quinone reductase-like Zn-dependent oxidoreductase
MVSFGNASGPVPPFAPAVLAPKSLYVTRATLFTHIATRERCQAMADDLFKAVESGQVRIPSTSALRWPTCRPRTGRWRRARLRAAAS